MGRWYVGAVGVLSQSWAEMIGTLVRWCGWGFVPIMGPNDWDVGAVGVLSQSWAQMIGTLVRWCGWGFVPIMGPNDWGIGTLVRLGFWHTTSSADKEQKTEFAENAGGGGIGMYPFIYPH